MSGVGLRTTIGLVVGPALFVAMLLAIPPGGMTVTAWRTAAVGALMAVWWITEAIPIPATALLPIVLFPLLGVATIGATTAPYANEVIFLFLGGFLIALALESCGLHRRMALLILRIVGTRPANLILGFMIATAFISMWVSNTATVVMMLPMATSVITLRRGENHLSSHAPGDALDAALLLGVAYAASIGGLGTLIGTPPNALFAGFMQQTYGIQIGFLDWMMLGVPIVLVALPFAWLVLTRLLYRLGSEPVAGGAAMLENERSAIGPMSRAEWGVGAITALTAAAWMTRPALDEWVPALTDAGIAIAGALLLFIVPMSVRPLRAVLTWKQAERLPWSVLILFGGGLSLAAAIQQTGLSAWIGGALGALAGWPVFAVLLAVTTVIILLSELASNTATAAAFLPVAASLALVIGADPLLLTLTTALAASGGFMLPVATPPNAIVYGTGALTIPEMARAGALLNIFFVLLLPLAVYFLAGRIFG
ncbi:MAG TPA: DASS family sodium-coupled anion symporter [Gemmatimonadaceae bacterium]|nr:DASS family sodium-coupled anion symporter [Gemmatimonadaceae bacterium]